MIKKIILINILCLLTTNLLAQISTDGSLGPNINLSGPDYQVGAELGQQRGGNLFHSFQTFNLQPGESATFSGPNTIQNIISRVTGGNPSYLNGLIRSTMPEADFYFLNPYGIIFGPNVSLDINGSFHASTADYLSFDDGGYFDARNSNDSLLTVAPVEAFGFLNHQPGAITLQGSYLKVSENNTLSLIGGEITSHDGTLFAESGRINLVAMASPGEVDFTLSELLTTPIGPLGTITLSQSSWDHFHTRTVEGKPFPIANVDVSGQGGGEILIRAGELFLDRAFIFADIDVGGYQPSFIDIFIDGDLQLVNGARIIADNLGEGFGGNVTINTTDSIFLLNFSRIASISDYSTGKAGEIKITTPHLELKQSAILSSSFGTGNAGSIEITTDTAHLIGSRVTTEAFQAGGGNIFFNVHSSLSIVDKSGITAEALGSRPQDNGGNLFIGQPQFFHLKNSYLRANAYAGNGGNINIQINNFIGENSQIDVSSRFGLNGHFQVNGIEFQRNHPYLSLPPKLLPVPILVSCPPLSSDELPSYFKLREGGSLLDLPGKSRGGSLLDFL